MSIRTPGLVRQGLRTLRYSGARTATRKAAQFVYTNLGDGVPDLPLSRWEVADSTRLNLAVPIERPSRQRHLTIGWVCSPPALGSGGHTTMFRMVRALEEAGHKCIIHLYNLNGADLATYTSNMRRGWPAVNAPVRSATEPFPDLDACIATSWESAHVLATHFRQPMRRLYFVQDFEPYFHARGSEYALAADSYRFGFRIIALGHMVADCISKEVGIETEIVEFGCDTSIYQLQDKTTKRNGVVFYARSQTPRRGYWLGTLALQEFSKRHPDIPIYIYGSKLDAPLLDATVFPRLTPAELNSLYNRCTAGLAMSFTNISLIAEELLAAGCIPIVNDSPLSRADLNNPFVAWAHPTPGGIADTLSEVVTSIGTEGQARSAAASVRGGWAQSEKAVVRIVEDEVYGCS